MEGFFYPVDLIRALGAASKPKNFMSKLDGLKIDNFFAASIWQ